MNPRIRLAHRIAVDGVEPLVGALLPESRGLWMRLFGRLVPYVRSYISEGKCQIICADNIAENYCASERQRWEVQDFPCRVQPFPDTFIECRWPKFTNFGNGDIRSNSLTPWSGTMVRADRYLPEQWVRVFDTYNVIFHDIMKSPDKDVVARCRLFMDTVKGGKPFFINQHVHVVVIGSRCVMLPHLGIYCLDEVGSYAGSILLEDHATMAFDNGTYSGSHIAHLTASFMSCKNSHIVPMPESELPEEKWTRRQGDKVKGLVFKTLRIDGMSGGPRAESGEPSGAHNRFHICRGSFAEYTAERPLFGKYTGRFWRPAHVKGSKEVGEVVKDYEVGPRNGVEANAH